MEHGHLADSAGIAATSNAHENCRRSVGDANIRSPPSQSEHVHYSHSSDQTTRNRTSSFARKRFHLQDPSWNYIKRDGPTATDLLVITKHFDRLGLATKVVSEQVGRSPPSSARLDWFYNSAERRVRRRVLKQRLRRDRGQLGEQENECEPEDKGGEEQRIEEIEAEHDVVDFEMQAGESSTRKHSF